MILHLDIQINEATADTKVQRRKLPRTKAGKTEMRTQKLSFYLSEYRVTTILI